MFPAAVLFLQRAQGENCEAFGILLLVEHFCLAISPVCK